MLLDHFDEIESASDSELLRLYRQTLFRNTNGRFDQRLERMIAEIKRRAEDLMTVTPFVCIETKCPVGDTTE